MEFDVFMFLSLNKLRNFFCMSTLIDKQLIGIIANCTHCLEWKSVKNIKEKNTTTVAIHLNIVKMLSIFNREMLFIQRHKPAACPYAITFKMVAKQKKY